MAETHADIWQRCQGSSHIRPISGTLFRLVENQEQVATLSYVDSLAEQSVLEELLDRSKPDYAPSQGALHYLLKTPFRYPPLPWGSRFGQTHQAGIFYGGGSIKTTLAEAAFYRFVFWHSMAAAPVKPAIRSQHSLFSAAYKTQHGIQLQAPPFDGSAHLLAHPDNYTATQQIGADMRSAGVQAFEYPSARDEARGLCVGLFTPAALKDKRPQDISAYLCVLTAQDVSFKSLRSGVLHHFGIADFLVSGKLPYPP